MKKFQEQASAGSQTKALSVVVACVAGSLVSSMTVVSFLIKWLAQG